MKKNNKIIASMIGIVLSMIVYTIAFSGCGRQDNLKVQSEMDLLLGNEAEGQLSGQNSNSDAEGDLSSTDNKNGNNGFNETVNSIVVHIIGAVTYPGVYELEEGCRVAQAIEVAGGYTEQACGTWLNQARVLSDGEQIYVPTTDEVAKWQSAGEVEAPIEESATSDASKKDSKVNINKATVEELMNLPGIGESKAKSIVDYREKNGKFARIEDLMLVPGIKEGVYNQIKDFIHV